MEYVIEEVENHRSSSVQLKIDDLGDWVLPLGIPNNREQPHLAYLKNSKKNISIKLSKTHNQFDHGTARILGRNDMVNPSDSQYIKLHFDGEKMHGDFSLIKNKRFGKSAWYLINETNATPLYSVQEFLNPDTSVIPISLKPKYAELMIASNQDLRFSTLKTDSRFYFEEKISGKRVIVNIGDDDVTFKSDKNEQIEIDPKIMMELKSYRKGMILDAILNDGKNQVLTLIDILWFDGKDLRMMPLQFRKFYMENVLKKSSSINLIDYYDTHNIFTQGHHLIGQTLIAKRKLSRYSPTSLLDQWIIIGTISPSGVNPKTNWFKESGKLFLALIPGISTHEYVIENDKSSISKETQADSKKENRKVRKIVYFDKAEVVLVNESTKQLDKPEQSLDESSDVVDARINDLAQTETGIFNREIVFDTYSDISKELRSSGESGGSDTDISLVEENRSKDDIETGIHNGNKIEDEILTLESIDVGVPKDTSKIDLLEVEKRPEDTDTGLADEFENSVRKHDANTDMSGTEGKSESNIPEPSKLEQTFETFDAGDILVFETLGNLDDNRFELSKDEIVNELETIRTEQHGEPKHVEQKNETFEYSQTHKEYFVKEPTKTQSADSIMEYDLQDDLREATEAQAEDEFRVETKTNPSEEMQTLLRRFMEAEGSKRGNELALSEQVEDYRNRPDADIGLESYGHDFKIFDPIYMIKDPRLSPHEAPELGSDDEAGSNENDSSNTNDRINQASPKVQFNDFEEHNEQYMSIYSDLFNGELDPSKNNIKDISHIELVKFSDKLLDEVMAEIMNMEGIVTPRLTLYAKVLEHNMHKLHEEIGRNLPVLNEFDLIYLRSNELLDILKKQDMLKSKEKRKAKRLVFKLKDSLQGIQDKVITLEPRQIERIL